MAASNARGPVLRQDGSREVSKLLQGFIDFPLIGALDSSSQTVLFIPVHSFENFMALQAIKHPHLFHSCVPALDPGESQMRALGIQ